MDRRKFLLTTAATVATGGLGRSRIAFAQSSINVPLMNAAMDQHASATANIYYNSGSVDDINAIAAANLTIGQHFSDIGLDSVLQPIMAGVTAAQVNLSSFSPAVGLAWMQQYAPDMTMADANTVMAGVMSNPSALPQALSNLQNFGLAAAFRGAGYTLQRRAAKLAPTNPMSSLRRDPRATIQSATFNPALQAPHLRRAQYSGCAGR